MNSVILFLRYLNSSPGKGLMFSRTDHVRVEGYTGQRTYQIGSWTQAILCLLEKIWSHGKVKKQKVVALSNVEAEFCGMAKGLCKLLWLKRLLTGLDFVPNSEMNLFCDNKTAIDIFHKTVQNDRTKHVEVDRNFIKQNHETKIIRFPFVKSEDRLVYILTKAIWVKVFYNSLDKLVISDLCTQTWVGALAWVALPSNQRMIFWMSIPRS